MPRILGIGKRMCAPGHGRRCWPLGDKAGRGSKSQGQGMRALSVASEARLEIQHTSLSADLQVVGRTQQTLTSKQQRTTKPMSPSLSSRGLCNGVDRPAIQVGIVNCAVVGFSALPRDLDPDTWIINPRWILNASLGLPLPADTLACGHPQAQQNGCSAPHTCCSKQSRGLSSPS